MNTVYRQPFSQHADVWAEILEYFFEPSGFGGSSQFLPIMQVCRLWKVLAEPLFLRLLHFTSAKQLHFAAAAFASNLVLCAQVARHTRVVRMLHSSGDWTMTPVEAENIDRSPVAISRSVIDDLLSVLTHVRLLEDFHCRELVTPEALCAVRMASTDSFGHDLLHTMNIELHVGSPLTLEQLGRFTHIRHLSLDYTSELPAPGHSDMASLPGWHMPLLESLKWSAYVYDDGVIGDWLCFLGRSKLPALRNVHWALFPMDSDDAAHAAAFFRNHPNIEQLRMDTARYGTQDVIPYIAVRRLYLRESNDEVYADLGPAIHPAVSQLVLETSPEDHEDLDALLEAVQDAPPPGLRTIILLFRGYPSREPFSWVDDPDHPLLPEEQTQTYLFRADMIPHVHHLRIIGIDLADELGRSIIGQQVVSRNDVNHIAQW